MMDGLTGKDLFDILENEYNDEWNDDPNIDFDPDMDIENENNDDKNEENDELLDYMYIEKVERKPYNRNEYLEQCKRNVNVQAGSNSRDLDFIITKVETHYAPKILKDIYSKEKPTYFSNHFLYTQGVIKKNDNASNGKYVHKKFKDMIFIRGRTIPKLKGGVSKNIMGYLTYPIPEYGPRFYIEAREGFDHSTYIESVLTGELVGSGNLATKQHTGPLRFIRWLQNYMYTKIHIKKEKPNLASFKERINITKSITTDNIVNPSEILGYSYLYNIPTFKSMWGKIPEPEEGGPNRYIIELTITSKSFAKKFLNFFQSDEYLSLAALKIVPTLNNNITPTIRTYEADIQFDHQWRMEHDIKFGCSYNIKNFEYMSNIVIKSTFTTTDPNSNIYVTFNYNSITKCEGSTPKSFAECNTDQYTTCKPIKCGFDIEVNNPTDSLLGLSFPTAKWSAQKYAERYKPLLKNDEKISISNCKDPIEARKKTIEILLENKKANKIMDKLENVRNRREFLEKVIPKKNDTDQITVIAGVWRQYERGTSIKSELGGFVYTWKQPSAVLNTRQSVPSNNLPPIISLNNGQLPPKNTLVQGQHKLMRPKITSHEINFLNITSNDEFSNIKPMVFGSEYEMLSAFLATFLQKNPDLLVGHNILSFDIPYITDRMEFLEENDFNVKNKHRENPFTFGVIRGHKARYYSYEFNRNNLQKTTWINETPGISLYDSMKGYRHETFGNKGNGNFSLSSLMPSTLTYPGTDKKMRKLEISILKSSKMWEHGGDGLAYFVGYCLFDALGSVMISEIGNYFDTIFFTAEITSAVPDSIMIRGVQNIVISMFYKTLWDNGKKYLFPDYGTRELHFIDLWYWHYNHYDPVKKTYKYTDVRELYETVPILARKWKMGGLRLIPDYRNLGQTQFNLNPYLPKIASKEYIYCCYNVEEIKRKKKSNDIPKSKAYIGALVWPILCGLFLQEYLLTGDFLSMYPTMLRAMMLDFPFIVTEFTKRIFNIPRMCLVMSVFGPSNLIQTGDVMKNKQIALQRGIYDTDEIAYGYFYQETDITLSVAATAIDVLLTNRKIAKDKAADWKFQIGRMRMLVKLNEFVTENWNFHNTINTLAKIKNDLTNIKDDQKKALDFNGKDFIDDIINICSQSNDIHSFVNKVTFKFKNDKTIILLEGYNENNINTYKNLLVELKMYLRRSIIEEKIYDALQLSEKLVLNSTYGCVSMNNGKLPAIWIGSGITSNGKNFIFRSGKVIENTDLLLLVEKLGLKPTIEEKIGKTLESIRNNGYVGRIYGPTITNGDTDSVIYALRSELLPCPKFNEIVKKQISRGLVSNVNTFLPKYLVSRVTQEALPGEILITNDRIKSVMEFQAETTSIASENWKKKLYVQQTLEEQKPKMKGVASKKTDTHTIAARIESQALSKYVFPPINIECGESTRSRALEQIIFVRKELIKFLSGDYNPADLQMKMRLNRPIESYKATGKKMPDHVIAAEKKIKRGEEVNVGDYIKYVYVIDTSDTSNEKKLYTDNSIDRLFKYMSDEAIIEFEPEQSERKRKSIEKKNDENIQKFRSACSNLVTNLSCKKISDSRIVECADYALKNNLQPDIIYCLLFKILPKLTALITPLIGSYRDYPKLNFEMSKEEKKEIKKNITLIEKHKNELAYDVLTSGKVGEMINTLRLHRLQREVIQASNKRNINYLPDILLHVCVNCNNYFEEEYSSSMDPILKYNFLNEKKNEPGFYNICNTCKEKYEKEVIVTTMKTKIKESSEKYEKCTKSCWDCIKDTKVSIRSSKVVDYKNGKLIENRDLYYTTPDDCSMDMCDVYKEKTYHKYSTAKVEQSLSVLNTIPEW